MEKTESPPSATKREELDDATRMKKTESVAKDEVEGSELQNLKTPHLTSCEKVKETKCAPSVAKDEAGGSEKRQEVKELVEWIADLKPLLNLGEDLAVHSISELHFRRSCEELKEALESIEHLEAANPFVFKNPKNLFDLGIVFCGYETEDMFKRMPKLKDVKEGLVNRDLLKTLPESIAQLKGLKMLDLSLCRMLEKLPESIGELKQLETLNLVSCWSLKKLPESIGELKQLKTLILSTCLLEKLPESIFGLKGLKDLNLSRCKKLEKLPESIGELKGLENLYLSRCEQLENLPESIGELKELKQLNLSLCPKLRTLPKSISELQKLEILEVSVFVNVNVAELEGWQHKLMALRAQYGSAKLKSHLPFYKLKSKDINLCEYELWQQFILSLHDDFESSSMFETLRLENLSVKKLGSASRMSQQEKAQNLSEHLSAMWEQLLKTPSSPIKRVFEFSDTAIDLQSRERGVRIFCNMSASGRVLEFHFENPKNMSKVVGIGIKDPKATLTRNMETLMVFGSYKSENQWEKALLVQASKEDNMYDDLLVMFPHVDKDKELQYSALSSRKFGVGFKGSDETNITVSLNTCDSEVCMIEVTPLLWEVGKHFLLKRINEFAEKTESSYLSNNDSNKDSNKGDSRGENNNSSSSHLGECSSQSNAAISSGRSEKAPGDDGDYSGSDDEGDNGDKDEKHNPTKKAKGDKKLNGTVIVVFKKGVGHFNCKDRRQPVPRDLQKDALFFPKIKFQFDKNDRKITISSRVHFELSRRAQPKSTPSDEFGWLHDELRIYMSSKEQINPPSLDDESKYGLFKDFEGTPLAEIGKESETVSSTSQGIKAMESGTLFGGAVRLPSVADVSGSLSNKITTTHQESHVTGEIIENSSNSVLPGGFTYISSTDERRGHLEYEIMFLKPLHEAIPDPAILWSKHSGRNRIRTSGRCMPFNAIIRGTWIDLDDQEEAICKFECERMLSKLHRDTSHNGYSERKVEQSFLFWFTLNHKMTHLSTIPQSGKVETDEGGQKVIVPQLLNQLVAA